MRQHMIRWLDGFRTKVAAIPQATRRRAAYAALRRVLRHHAFQLYGLLPADHGPAQPLQP
jgi:hypothetical protein